MLGLMLMADWVFGATATLPGFPRTPSVLLLPFLFLGGGAVRRRRRQRGPAAVRADRQLRNQPRPPAVRHASAAREPDGGADVSGDHGPAAHVRRRPARRTPARRRRPRRAPALRERCWRRSPAPSSVPRQCRHVCRTTTASVASASSWPSTTSAWWRSANSATTSNCPQWRPAGGSTLAGVECVRAVSLGRRARAGRRDADRRRPMATCRSRRSPIGRRSVPMRCSPPWCCRSSAGGRVLGVLAVITCHRPGLARGRTGTAAPGRPKCWPTHAHAGGPSSNCSGRVWSWRRSRGGRAWASSRPRSRTSSISRWPASATMPRPRAATSTPARRRSTSCARRSPTSSTTIGAPAT